MKLFLLNLLLFSCLGMNARAQAPEYSSNSEDSTLRNGRITYKASYDKVEKVRLQVIYHSKDFAGARPGRIKNLYVRTIQKDNQEVDAVYPKFSVKMGYTEKAAWSTKAAQAKKSLSKDRNSTRNYQIKSESPMDTFATDLTTVYYDSSLQLRFVSDSIGTWLKIPANAGEFNFDPKRNFVVEVSTEVSGLYASVCMNRSENQYTMLSGFSDERTGKASFCTPELGFDIEPNDVEQIMGLKSVGLFPNPTSTGRAWLSFETLRPVSHAEIHISDMTGREIRVQAFNDNATTFLRELNLNSLPPGNYVVNVMLDGKWFTRQLVIR